MDRLSASPWNAPETVAGFAQSAPNPVLMRFAADELARTRSGRALDLGCGAGRNAIPLAQLGWEVFGLDLSIPMLTAAARRIAEEQLAARVYLTRGGMDAIPIRDGSVDLVIAHGIWNLARSGAEFRNAVHEAARVSRPGAALFVFTFSRHTLPPQAAPVAGDPFVFTQFSGEPQCFLSEDQLVTELAAGGFTPDAGVPLAELNLPRPGALQAPQGPVIYQAAFRYAR